MLIRLFAILCVLLPVLAAEDEPPARTGRSIVIERPDPARKMITETIPLRDIGYAELKPMLEPLLSDRGSLGYYRARKVLFVHDRREVVDRIKAVVAQLDQDSVNIRVHVRFDNAFWEDRLGVDVTYDGERKRPTIIIDGEGVHLPKQAEISVDTGVRETKASVTQSALVRSGESARLTAVKQVPEPKRVQKLLVVPLNDNAQRAQPLVKAVHHEFATRELGSALYVQPTMRMDGLVEVTVFPVLTTRGRDGERQSFRVQQVQTKVVVQPGKPLQIAGNDQASRSFSRDLLGNELYQSRQGHDLLAMELWVEVVRPGGR